MLDYAQWVVIVARLAVGCSVLNCWRRDRR